MRYQCTDCNNKIEVEEIKECIDCGTELCTGCYSKNRKRCEKCYEDLEDGVTNEDLDKMISYIFG